MLFRPQDEEWRGQAGGRSCLLPERNQILPMDDQQVVASRPAQPSALLGLSSNEGHVPSPESLHPINPGKSLWGAVLELDRDRLLQSFWITQTDRSATLCFLGLRFTDQPHLQH